MECKLGDKIKNVIQNLTGCVNNKNNEEEEIKCYDSILKYIEDIYTSKQYNTSFIDDGNDEIIEKEKMKIILTSSQNQKKI